jgi:hypothetical protein
MHRKLDIQLMDRQLDIQLMDRKLNIQLSGQLPGIFIPVDRQLHI